MAPCEDDKAPPLAGSPPLRLTATIWKQFVLTAGGGVTPGIVVQAKNTATSTAHGQPQCASAAQTEAIFGSFSSFLFVMSQGLAT